MKKLSITIILTVFVLNLFCQSRWLDTTFADHGIFREDSMYTYAQLIQADGKVVLGGCVYKTFLNPALSRLNQDGSIDSSFGVNGYVLLLNENITALRSNWALTNALAQEPNGKIIASGTAGGQDAFQDEVPFLNFLARYNLNGSVDSSFGTNGFIIDYYDSTWLGRSCIAMTDSYNRVFICASDYPQINYPGVGFPAYHYGYRIFCYDSIGRLDTIFGTEGGIYVSLDIGATIFSACVQPDQKILLGGADSTQSVFSLIRFTSSGRLDSAFGVNGVATISCDTADRGAFNSICVQSDGRILASKYLSATDTGYFKISRFLSNGSIDYSFGFGGCTQALVQAPYIQNTSNGYTQVAQSPDGSIMIGSSSVFDSAARQRGYMAFARFYSDGTIDASFGEYGFLNEPVLYYNHYDFPVMTGFSALSNGGFIASSGNQTNRYFGRAINTGIMNKSETAFDIYPNPASDRLYINGPSGEYDARLIDMSGRIWLVPIVSGRIDISDLPLGIYAIAINTDTCNGVKKFVKE